MPRRMRPIGARMGGEDEEGEAGEEKSHRLQGVKRVQRQELVREIQEREGILALAKAGEGLEVRMFSKLTMAGKFIRNKETERMLKEVTKGRARRDGDKWVPSMAQCEYTMFYSEENVWHLCNHIKRNSPEELKRFDVVFISNKHKTVPLYNHALGNAGFALVDYHVILVSTSPDDLPMVYDLDSMLDFPTPLDDYAASTFGNSQDRFKKEHRHMFRVVNAEDYLDHFSSDRSHMKESVQKSPTTPTITVHNYPNNLPHYVDMGVTILSASYYGKVMGYFTFYRHYFEGREPGAPTCHDKVLTPRRTTQQQHV